ncbi:hypothetical protein AJ80_06971 [Polytolypa hystricis UAMH7299]|uniref:Sugar phosphate transporter domain-containing protein n=1 Tax=Polytolypa hystricis (strain UAMH7299) TaxID=1447883 RepID=A0A2B7XSS4_POLH7|nr:hypothetical protein AJ80_06971 [Polytolypa hystricis UAMH7299]
MASSPNSASKSRRRKANAASEPQNMNGANGEPQKRQAPDQSVHKGDLAGKKEDKQSGSFAAAVAQSTLPAWANVAIMTSLIFGGCCANVFALEAIIIDDPGAGALITFTQFIVTAVLTLPYFFSLSAGPRSFFLSKRAISLRSWIIYTGFFMTVNLLNNSAFAFKISVPLHIILRSAGPVASMIIGYLYNGRRYSKTQISAVMLLTVGVVWAALADARSKGKSLDISLSSSSSSSSSNSSTTDSTSLFTTIVGFTILGLAMILSAFQGVYADRLYETHGRNHWREALFYSHALSLPFLIPSYPRLLPQLKALYASPPLLESIVSAAAASSAGANGSLLGLSNSSTSLLSAASATTSIPEALHGGSGSSNLPASSSNALSSILLSLSTYPTLHPIFSRTPIKIVYLLLNALTQYVCIRGVHLLSAKSSSLTVTIVLNVRKLVSLMLSVYMFGNVLVGGMLGGAAVVFGAGALYAYEGARLRRKAIAAAAKKE